MRPPAILSAMAAAWAACAGAEAQAHTIVVQAGHLIAEPGKPVADNQSVIIEGGHVVRIEPGFNATGDEVIDLTDSWVMPGLIDMHTHLYGVMDLDAPTAPQLAYATIQDQATMVLSILPRVDGLLMNGFTTIRSMGDQSSTTYALRDAIAAGSVRGPRMYVAEAQIAVDSGDLDASQMGVRPELESLFHNRGNCTGVVECTQVVRSEVRRGADFVKFRQSGMTFLDPAVQMAESSDEIHAVIDTAHQLHRRVAVHVNGTPAFLHAVVAAGADTIEHGPLDDQAIALMVQHHTTYVPTLIAGEAIHYRFDEGLRFLGRAWHAGVNIAFGTDLGIVTLDQQHQEFLLYQRAGLPADQVLRTATVNAAASLGQSDALGVIAANHSADLIAMRVDPYAHLDQLGVAASTNFVMKEGVVYKNTH